MVCPDYLTLHPSLILRRISELYTDESSQNGICSVCFIPNSDYLATAGQDGQIRVSWGLGGRVVKAASLPFRHQLSMQVTGSTPD